MCDGDFCPSDHNSVLFLVKDVHTNIGVVSVVPL